MLGHLWKRVNYHPSAPILHVKSKYLKVLARIENQPAQAPQVLGNRHTDRHTESLYGHIQVRAQMGRQMDLTDYS